ncbi:MAG: hypothetical protein U0V54_00380 [Saprospiraceae bacterium]|nr:hypothetical protein [Saprospiraceae bacterium]
MKFHFALILLSVSMVFTSCATIFSKGVHDITITSNPANAKISVVNKKGKEVFTGTTPATVKLSAASSYLSKEEYTVTFTTPGYQSKTVPIVYKMNGWYLGNLLIGGVVGMLVVDPLSGAMWKPVTNAISIDLVQGISSTSPQLNVIDIADLTPTQKANLIRIN